MRTPLILLMALFAQSASAAELITLTCTRENGDRVVLRREGPCNLEDTRGCSTPLTETFSVQYFEKSRSPVTLATGLSCVGKTDATWPSVQKCGGPDGSYWDSRKHVVMARKNDGSFAAEEPFATPPQGAELTVLAMSPTSQKYLAERNVFLTTWGQAIFLDVAACNPASINLR